MLDFPIASSAEDRRQPSGGRLERQFAPVIPGRYRSGHLEDASLTEERYHVRAGHAPGTHLIHQVWPEIGRGAGAKFFNPDGGATRTWIPKCPAELKKLENRRDLADLEEFKRKLTIWAEGVELGGAGRVTRCDEFATSTAHIAANKGNATQNEMAVMDRVAIIPVVRESLCKSEELGSLRLCLRVPPAREVTSCGVLEADETERRAPENRTEGVGHANLNSNEKSGQSHAEWG